MDVVNPTDRIPHTSMDNDSSACHCVCYDSTQSTYDTSYEADKPRCSCNCAPASVNPYNEDANFELAHNALGS